MKKILCLLLIAFSFQSFIGPECGDPPTAYDAPILKYCKKHKLNATKLPSGLYYVIQEQGTGEKVTDSMKVNINYTGRLINGKTFDSNVLEKFKHVSPFEYVVGTGMVVKGFEQGIKLLNTGGKAVLLFPPSLGYENREIGPIKPNSVLIFEVEVMAAK